MSKRIIITAVLVLTQILSHAQENQETIKNITPIVQVFASARYNIENKQYDYSFGRAHLGFQYQFNKKWSAKIIIDRGRATSVGNITVLDSTANPLHVENSSTEGAYYTMFLKFASLRWQVNEKLTLEGGAILQNHYITQERFWGLRYVAQTFQDLYWHIPSSDLGFIAYYKLNRVFSFDAAITNGEGPRKIQDSFGSVKYSGGIDLTPSENFQARLYYHNRPSGLTDSGTEQMYAVFMGCKPLKSLRIGSELNYMQNLNNLHHMNSYGFSLYSVYQLSNKTELFARFDKLVNEHSDNQASGTSEGKTMISGISHSPVKGVHLSLNFQAWLPDETTAQNKNSVLFSMEYRF